jgi:glycosidase
LRDIYRDLIKLRKQNAAFYSEQVVWLTNSVPEQTLSFLRRDAKNEFLVLINLSSIRVKGSVALSKIDGFEPVNISGQSKPVDTHIPDFDLGGYGWCIYHRTAPE